MKPKICILTSSHPPLDKRIYNKEALSLVKMGFEIDIIAPTKLNCRDDNNINIIGFTRVAKRVLFPVNWIRIYRLALKRRYSIYHFHDPDLLLLGIILKIVTSRPVIYDVHEHYPERILQYWQQNIFIQLLRMFFENFENLCSRIIHNTIVVENSQHYRFVKLKCNVIKLFNYAKMDDYVATIASKRGYNNNVAIHIGSLQQSRGAMEFIQIAKLVYKLNKKIKLVFVDWFYVKKERDLFYAALENEQAQKYIKIIPPVQSNQITNLLESADLGLSLLLPIGQSRKAIPTKLFEYMACGLPIIAEASPYNQQFVEKNDCGILVNHNDIEGFANAIVRLIANKELMRTMGANGKKAFIAKYNWELQENKLREYYQELCL
ncbi:MAG: glycosyltransferase [Candidatus Marinimicrobia bacterium]|nr:glycosyltransferase [Candidatus Neomarinimicrobiota bacterium]